MDQLLGLFYRSYGKQKAFYVESQIAEIGLGQDIVQGGSSFAIRGTEFFSTFADSVVYRWIRFNRRAADPVVKLVSSIDTIGGDTIVTVSTPFAEAVSVSEVYRAGWLLRSRFETDLLTLDWLTDGVAEVRTMFRILEVRAVTYPNREASVDQAIPIGLFLIRYGTGSEDHFAYSDSDIEVVHDGITYVPIPIGRESIDSSGGLDNKTLTIQIAPRAEVATYLETRTPTQEVTLVIRQGHADDPDQEFLVVWSGRIVAATRKDVFVEIQAESLATAMRRPGLHRGYQRSCPWALYEFPCSAPRTIRATISPITIGRNVLGVPADWNGSYDRTKFLGGYISWPDSTSGRTHVRTILDITTQSATEDYLHIQGSTEGLDVASTLRIYLGCNHLTDDCIQLHDNIVNFGGQPFIPLVNPVGTNRFF